MPITGALEPGYPAFNDNYPEANVDPSHASNAVAGHATGTLGGTFQPPVAAIAAAGQGVLAGTFAAGETVTSNVAGHATVYTVVSGDTTDAILAGHVRDALNADGTFSAAYLATASGNNVVVTDKTAGAAGNAVTLVCSTNSSAGTYTASGAHLAGGADAIAADTVTTTVAGHATVYTLVGGDTTKNLLAASIRDALNADTTFNAGYLATAVGVGVVVTDKLAGEHSNTITFVCATNSTLGTYVASGAHLAGGVDDPIAVITPTATFPRGTFNGPTTFYKGKSVAVSLPVANELIAAGLATLT